MKILQINKFFWNKGGSESYFFSLQRLLEQRGHGVMHFSMHSQSNLSSPYADYFLPEIDFQAPGSALRKAGHFLYSTQAKEYVARLIRAEKPDLAHVHNIAHQLTPAILPVLKAYGIPVVHTLHDYQLICPNYKLFTQGKVCERCFQHKYINAARFKCVDDSPSKGALAGVELAMHRLIIRSYDSVDVFICPSRFLYDKLIAWGIDKKRLVYLPHFIETITHTSSSYPLTRNQEFLFVGRLNAEKGIDVFLQAAQQLPQSQFAIMGQAETAQETERYAGEAKALPNVRWLGFRSDRVDILRIIAQAKAVVVPSRWYENAPLSVLEALSQRTWVIASNNGGLPELIEQGKNGLLCAPGSVDSVVQAIQKTNEMGNPTGPGLKQAHTPDYHYQQILRIYQSILHAT